MSLTTVHMSIQNDVAIIWMALVQISLMKTVVYGSNISQKPSHKNESRFKQFVTAQNSPKTTKNIKLWRGLLSL